MATKNPDRFYPSKKFIRFYVEQQLIADCRGREVYTTARRGDGPINMVVIPHLRPHDPLFRSTPINYGLLNILFKAHLSYVVTPFPTQEAAFASEDLSIAAIVTEYRRLDPAEKLETLFRGAAAKHPCPDENSTLHG